MPDRAHHRPLPVASTFFERVDAGTDPARLREAAERAAAVLVRGARASEDPAVAERVLTLADTEGLEALAEVWAGAPAESLSGALWRLYVLRAWVHADPVAASREFEAGQHAAQVARVVSSVPDPPTPDELRATIDAVLRGVALGEFADVLARAGALARVVAVGRMAAERPAPSTPRMRALADELSVAAELEHRGQLG